MAYEVLVHELAAKELEGLRVFDHRRIVDAIEEQLLHQPLVTTKRRKCLGSLQPRFEHVPPVWELRVGAYRVFYDVDAAKNRVHVRAIRHKGATQTTGDIV